MDAALLKLAISDLNAELAARNYPYTSLIVVGGACLILSGLRDMSNDIDTVELLDEKMKEAIKVVGRKHGLRDVWLNDEVRAVMPANFDKAKCTVNMQLSHIEILLPSLDVIFIMKLKADRGDDSKDYEDMLALWPRCSFKTAQDALLTYQLTWPGDCAGSFMENYIQEIIDKATK
jgi:hypothetical protein